MTATAAPGSPVAHIRREYRAVRNWVVIPSVVVALSLASVYFVAIPIFPVIRQYYFVQQAHTYGTYWLPLDIHIAGGACALILGPINLLIGLRRRRSGKRWHPVIGRAYALAVAIAAPSAVVMAFHAYRGTLAGGRVIVTSGFTTLAVVWLGTLVLAVHAITVKHDVSRHRTWMIVNVALTFAAVTLRAQNVLLLTNGTFELLYPLLAWTCWVPNLIVALLLARRLRRATVTQQPPPAGAQLAG